MTQPRIHIIYEHGVDLRPFSTAQIRLLRPFSHSPLPDQFTTTYDWSYHGESADIVIVDRLWCPDLSLLSAEQLVQTIRRAGARFVYALDDDFLSLSEEAASGYINATKRAAAKLWLQAADQVIVTTQMLQQRIAPFNTRCVIVPNALDERLLIGGMPRQIETAYGRRRVVIGYMGTLTHEADWRLILPAWQQVYRHYPDQVEFQVIGVADQAQALAERAGVPVRVLQLPADETEYPQFMLWFTAHAQWDIAVAPLLDTPFTRCKSDIKFLDYSVLGAATIASRVPVYESSVRQGETGWLAENTVKAWSSALETLIVDDEQRSTLARNARRYVMAERTLACCAGHWMQALEEVLKA